MHQLRFTGYAILAVVGLFGGLAAVYLHLKCAGDAGSCTDLTVIVKSYPLIAAILLDAVVLGVTFLLESRLRCRSAENLTASSGGHRC